MSPPASVCRICLAMGVRLLDINGPLQQVYEKITSTALHTRNKKPIVACYICHAQLRKCHNLMLTSNKADNVLNAIFHCHSKISVKSVSMFDRRANGLNWPLIATKPECYQNLDSSLVEIKTEPVATESDNEEHDALDMGNMVDIPDIKSECDDDTKSTTSLCNTDVDMTEAGGNLQLDNMVDIPVVKGECDVDTEEEAPSQYIKDVTSKEATKGFPQPMCVREISGVKTENEDPLCLPECNADMDVKKGDDKPSTAEKHIDAESSTTDEIQNQRDSNSLRSTAADEKKENKQDQKAKNKKLPHQCKVCKRRFTTSGHMKTHLGTHTGEKPYQCKVCKKRFKRNDMLIRHSRTHDSEKPHNCVFCQKQFKRTEHLKRHLKTHDGEKPYECTVCKNEIKGIENIMTHLRSHVTEKHYECNECKRRFRQKSNLVKHLGSHMDDKHKCHFCKRWFKHSNNLSRHLKTQHWRETYMAAPYLNVNVKCEPLEHTDSIFKETNVGVFKELTMEIEVVPDIPEDMAYPEDETDEHIQSNDNYQSYTENTEQAKSAKPMSRIELRMQSGDRPHECTLCHRRFTQKHHLKSHTRTHTGEKPYSCHICQRRFNQIPHLKRHLETHTDKMHECDACQQQFNNINDYKIHLKSHTDDRPFECEICHFKFKRKFDLKIHFRGHTGEKPYVCTICQRGFTTDKYLQTHMSVHSNERPYQCPICENRFKDKNYLNIHLRTHTGEKPYGCTVCEARFKRASELKMHSVKHSDEKRFRCHVCQRDFKYMNVLTKHLRIHTGEKPYECPVCYRTFSRITNMKSHNRRIHEKTPDKPRQRVKKSSEGTVVSNYSTRRKGKESNVAKPSKSLDFQSSPENSNLSNPASPTPSCHGSPTSSPDDPKVSLSLKQSPSSTPSPSRSGSPDFLV
ncbi:zinc finger protein 271-like [Plodia interpunctella]|uniref:zinc finger protein 271-like n=1 Tax=Plodia interpunctella TaxID=58824 RepID=UPI0031012BDC